MTKSKEIKEIREIKSKVRVIREIERENNEQEDNFNEFLEIDRLRFLQGRSRALGKKKDGEKLEGVIDEESIKEENKAREDLRNRGNVDEREDLRSLYGTSKEGDSQRYYGGNQQQTDTPGRSFIDDSSLNRQGFNQNLRNENNLRQTGNNTNYERNYVQDENKEKKKRDLM